jgi:SpoVK/Ycf46/Vps4 family AAA+-type ATPase
MQSMTRERDVELETWYPDWSRQLAQAASSGASQFFILHGNTSDLIRVEKKDSAGYSMLPEFLAAQLFGNWDSVLYYDQVRGPRALANSQSRLDKINKHVERFIGPVEQLRDLRQVGKVFPILDRYLELALLKEGERPSICIVLDYAHFMAPSSSVSNTARELAPTLATLLNWAKSPYFKRAPFAFCLISERLSDLHDSLVRNAHTLSIELPFPGRDERLRFILWTAAGRSFEELCEVSPEQLADFTSGLTLVHLQGLLQRAVRTGRKLDLDDLKKYKKRMIEGECQGLVEFIEPSCTLDLVAGQTAAKQRLSEDAGLIRKGRLDAVPMGYLLCGPVGTGKTFLAECYAGSVGIPCVKLLNFRSKYVGETEGNLEKILKVLRVMGPVAVIIDEADAMMGDRQSGSDSGTQGRVFGQFAAQMGNTEYRGKIIWFLLTCRPDLLPIDLKRQGRCEVHIPLFYPKSEEEFRQMFLVMGKKNHIDIDPDEIPSVPEGAHLSGADIEGIANRARRLALLEGRNDVAREHLERAFADFIPSAQTREKELQVLAAVIESTEMSFLPEDIRDRISTPNGRDDMMRRFLQLKLSLGE